MTPADRLRHAQQAEKEALDAWRADIFNSELRARYAAADDAMLEAEGLAAAAEGLPHAVAWQSAGHWPGMTEDAAVSVGTFIAVVTFGTKEGVIQVAFKHPDAVRVSRVNDEVFNGHPLTGKGLTPYRSFTVENSPWIEELRQCHSVHLQYDPSHWRAARHYLLWFKDRMCEIVTRHEPAWASFATRSEALQAAPKLCEQ